MSRADKTPQGQRDRLANTVALSGVGCPLSPDLEMVSGPPRSYQGDPMAWYQIPRLRIEQSRGGSPEEKQTAYGLPIVTTVTIDYGEINGQPITCQVRWGGEHPPQLVEVDGTPIGSAFDLLSIERIDPDRHETVRIVYAPTILHPEDAPVPEEAARLH